MKYINKYVSEFINLVGHPEELSQVYAQCKDDEELKFYILDKYNYMTELIRRFANETLGRSFGIEKIYSIYRNYIISNIEYSSMELCSKYGLNWSCYDNKYIVIDNKKIAITDGFAKICETIINGRTKSRTLARKESLN